MSIMEPIKHLKENVRCWIGENHKTIALTVGGIYLVYKVGSVIKEKADKCRIQKAMEKWTKFSQNVVILHTLPRGKTVPNLSPFAMKLETYLRIAKIPYKVDFELPWGPVGKTPWITYNGQHVYDSQLIMNLLNKEFNVTIGNYSEEERAVGKAVRIMMDEYMYWGVALWRYVYSEGKGLSEIFDMSPRELKGFYKNVNNRVKSTSWSQGLGRHSKEQVISMIEDSLKTASLILGDKMFLLGDEACEEDCSFFGFLSMFLWAAPGSPYEKYLNEETPNLKEYCIRVKETFWTDWNQCLAKAKH